MRKYLITTPNTTEIITVRGCLVEDDAISFERINEYGSSMLRVVKSENNKVYRLVELEKPPR